MKRVRIMFTAIGIFAIVGGALAFKAKTFGVEDYCTKSNVGNEICTSWAVNKTFNPGSNLKYVVTSNTANCTNGTVSCPNIGNIAQ